MDAMDKWPGFLLDVTSFRYQTEWEIASVLINRNWIEISFNNLHRIAQTNIFKIKASGLALIFN